MFALRHKVTKKIARIEILGNGHDTEYHISFLNYESNFYVFDSKKDAETAANGSGTIYMSSLCSPINTYVGQLEVVELGIKE